MARGAKVGMALAVAALASGCGTAAVTTRAVTTATGDRTAELAHRHTGPRAVTTAAVRRLLAQVRQPAGAVLVTDPPHGLAPFSSLQADHRVARQLVYTVPMSMDRAIHWYRAHPPRDTTTDGSSVASVHGRVTQRGLGFVPPRVDTRSYQQLEADVTVSPRRGGSWIVISASAVWMPPRTPAEHVPSSATSVTVVRSGPSGRHVDTVQGPDVRTLARLVNGLATAEPGVEMCPMDDGQHDRLVFHGPFAPKVFDATATGCGYVDVRAAGHRQPTLANGGAVDHVVGRLVG